jgi:uncharacterized protein YcbK (DUF882 family)
MSDWNPQETPSFTPSEMGCKCGKCDGEAKMSHPFMIKLQAMRDAYGPMTITSGYRCPEHPEEKRKEKVGAHGQGRAADIAVGSSKERFNIMAMGVHVGMQGIGVARSFVHVDDGHKHAPRPACWKY